MTHFDTPILPPGMTWKQWHVENPDIFPLPCGKCVGCRLDKARDWATRCVLESRQWSDNWFLTLTYDDDHVPKGFYSDPDTGIALQSLTLRKSDLQKFWKRLRKEFQPPIRYFCCGEYGESTFRPHYHAIVYNLPLKDLEFYSTSDFGNLYTSKTLDSIWKNGSVKIGQVTYQSASYVARYTAKKFLDLPKEFFSTFDMEPPFIEMSRRPGIGMAYVEKVKRDQFFLPTPEGSKPVSVPSSFLRKIEDSDPLLYQVIKECRAKRGNLYQKASIYNSDFDYNDLLKEAEKLVKNRTKKLLTRGDF